MQVMSYGTVSRVTFQDAALWQKHVTKPENRLQRAPISARTPSKMWSGFEKTTDFFTSRGTGKESHVKKTSFQAGRDGCRRCT